MMVVVVMVDVVVVVLDVADEADGNYVTADAAASPSLAA